jgi:hypothetical protein
MRKPADNCCQIRTLLKKPKLTDKYQEGLTGNIVKRYLGKVNDADLQTGWYLTHIPVVCEEKETTKVSPSKDEQSQ